MVVLMAASAWAGGQLQVDIDTTRLSVGQSVGLHITIVGGVPTAVPQITTPDGLTVRYANQTNGLHTEGRQIIRWTTYHYELIGDREGDYKLGPFTAEVGTQTLTNPPRSILVGPPPPPATDGPQRGGQTASATDLWEGQVVIWQYRVESKEAWLRSPSWEPARSAALVPVKESAEEHNQYTTTAPDGSTYVDEFYVAYRAVDVGDFEVGPALIRVDIPEKGHRSLFPGLSPILDPFAKFNSKILSTDPVSLRIKPLPPPPPTFTGLVGDFVVTQELSSQHLGVDGTADWKVSITGDGTLESFAFPKGADVDGVRFYEQSPSTKASLQDGEYTSQGKFSRQIVATRPGIIDLPATTLTWFSPTKGQYVSESIDPPPIEVTGEVAGIALKTFSDPDMAPPEVIDGIRPALTAGAAQRWRWMPFAWVAAAIPLFALLALALDAAVAWWRQRPRRDPNVAPITPVERLRRLPTEPTERLAALDAALRDAVTRRAGAVDREAALSALPDALRDRVRRALQGLDMARYADGRPAPDLEGLVRDAVVSLEAR